MGRWLMLCTASLLALAALLHVAHAEANHCLASGAASCSICIQLGGGCAYCSHENFDGPRCDLLDNLRARGCAKEMTAKGKMAIKENLAINTKLKRAQVAPQLIQMTLLPGEERVMDMEVFEPTRGPLDLYILMDFSNSMMDDLDNLKAMGAELSKLVGKLSDDYTIGFGKFVDKVTEPQTDMRDSKLERPWPNSDPPFSFKNAIALTSNVTSFTEELQKQRISGNLDAPEGGFDAILQTAVCQTQIGWRKDSTHLLVFSTESAFHYEADGANVLAGILKRNDEKCHLDKKGSYTDYKKQDYPSVPTLVRLLVQHNIIPIFAVTDHSRTYYEKLSLYFPIAELGILTDDSSNILTLLEKAFENIRSKISIRAENKPKAVDAQVLSYAGSSSEHGNFQIKPGQIGKFKVRVKAHNKVGEEHVCNIDQDDRQGTMRVKPTTFGSALNIQASVLCETCSCEATPTKNSPRCSGNGDLVCGKCKCHNDWLGPFCNCSAQTASDAGICIGPNMVEPCSGRGDCLCGTCVCYNPNQFEGPYCQFDKTQCHRYRGFLCNDRGRCFMGNCECQPGWTGTSCECPSSNQTCLDSKGGICNGRGACVCGRCDCGGFGSQLSTTCEASFEAQLGMCEDKRTCVQCQAWKTGKKKGEECDKCHFKAIIVDELKKNEEVIETCSFRDEDDDCTYYYTVDYPPNPTDKVHEVQVLKKKECPPAGFLWLIPLIMFLMLLLGLLALCCWKYCACCESCLAFLPCCAKGRMVGFKEDQYTLQESLLTSDHLDTPLVRSGPPKSTDVVRWKITDNVHRDSRLPQAQMTPNPKEMINFPLSLRLKQKFIDTLSNPDARDTKNLRQEVEDNLNDVYRQIPGLQRPQNTIFRTQRNAGNRQDHAIVDTVLSAPRSSYPDIVKLTEKQVQSGSFKGLKVIPGYYTVATDREATGVVEMQKDVEMVDVRVPLFIKEEDDDNKKLLVEAVDVPLGTAEIGRRNVKISVIKDRAKSIFSFLQPAYTYNRQDGVAKIPIIREIFEDGRTQVTYRTHDLSAKDKKDYNMVEGDLTYMPTETKKVVPVKLLELGEADSLLDDMQPKQFVMDLSNPQQGAKLGKYPRTTVTIVNQRGDDNIPVVDAKQSQGFINQTATSPGGRLFSPANIKPTATGPKSIRLNWTPTARALGYKVKYWIYGDPEEDAQIMDVKTPQAELTNLYPYCDYEMRVCAYNALGDGNYSEMVECQTLEDVPSEPGRLAFNVVSPTVTQVSWAEPAEPNGVITAYEVIYTPINEDNKQIGASKKVKIDNPKKRMLLIENLQPSQTYCYKVRGRNKVGWGPYRDATINLATQPTRPMSIPIIPDIPIVDAEAGEEYDSYLMYSNEVLRSPTGSKRPSVSDEDQLANGKWDQNFLFPGTGGSLSRNVSTSSSSYGLLSPRSQTNMGGIGMDTTTSYISTKAATARHDILASGGFGTEEVILRKRSERGYYDSDIRDSIVMGDMPSGFLDNQGGSSYSTTQVNYSMSSRARTQSEDVNDALLNLDRVLEGSRLTPGIPDTPTRLVFSALGPTALKVSWQEPHCEKDVQGYCVVYQLLNGGEMKRIEVNNPQQNSVVLQDLLPNQSYVFKVKAQSQEGWGPEREGVITIESATDPKSPLSPMPGSPFTLSTPSAPGPLIFTALSPEALQLSWEKPRKPNGEIVGYVVTCEQLHGGGDMRSFQVSGGNTETSLTVSDLRENVPYKFKVQAQTTQGFGPEREGIITIESQDGASMSQYSNQSLTKRTDVFNLPGEISTVTNLSHSMFSDPYFSDGMMMSTQTQHIESSGTITRQVEMVQRGVVSSTSVTKKMEKQYYQA